MNIKLSLEKAGTVVRKFSLDEGKALSVGKVGGDNMVELNDPTVSRKHAIISCKGGNVFATDLGSTNLTLLNGQPLAANQAKALNNGDRLRIGKKGQYEIRVEIQKPVFSVSPDSVQRQGGFTPDSGQIEILKNGNVVKSIGLIHGKKYVVGRPSFGNEIELDDSWVSRHHARMEVSATGQLTITDLGSTNQTYVNGMVLIPNQPIQLKNGDKVKVSAKGNFELRLRLRESKVEVAGTTYVNPVNFERQTAAKQPLKEAVKQAGVEQREGVNQSYAMKSIERLVKEEPAKLIPFRIATKWGFADPSRSICIPVIYDSVRPFSQSFAAVKSNGKWGFISEQGEVVFPFKYEEVADFKNGFAAVKLNGKWGFINRQGKEIIFPKYSAVKDFIDGVSLGSMNQKWGVINEQGYEVCTVKYDSIGAFQEGMAKVSLAGKCGFLNREGKERIAVKFAQAGDFSEGLAPVKIDEWENARYGYVDKDGKIVIPPKYALAKEFTEHYARVCFDKKWGYIDHLGAEKIPMQYKNAGPFSMGLAAIAASNFLWLEEKWGIIDKEGLIVVKDGYENAGFYAEGLAPVKSNGRWGFIDKFGNMAVHPRYEKIFLPDGSEFNNDKLMNYFKGGYLPVSIGGKKGFIDTLGNEVVPPKYSLVNNFSGEIAYVEVNGTGGYVNGKGQEFFE